MIWTLRIALLLLRVMMRIDDKTDVPGIVFLKSPTQMRTDLRTFVRERAQDQHLLGKGKKSGLDGKEALDYDAVMAET